MRVNIYGIETGENECPVIVKENAKNVTGVNDIMNPHAVVDIAKRLLNPELFTTLPRMWLKAT